MAFLVDLLANLFRLLGNLLARLPGPRADYVVLDLAGSYPERRAPRARFRPFRFELPLPSSEPEESLEELRASLERIAAASRVRGVVVRVGELGGGLATVQSLRDALLCLQGRGKRVVAYLTVIHTPQYYLATAAEEILLPESAPVGLVGLRAEITFLREALDRAGIAPDLERIAEYKTAADPLLRRTISPAHREMVESILDSQMEQIVGDVAAARRLSPEAVRAAIDRGPYTAQEAQALGLVDAILYEDELPLRLGAAGREASLLPWPRARRRIPALLRWPSLREAIAVVTLRGTIVTGESREMPVPLPLFGRLLAGSSTVLRAFRAAERMPRVRAVVFHVDSGGGSALASDLIWREVERIKRRTPVVAFMGDVAGSGGYYISCGASRIIAQPGTITGSIGVVSGKLVAAGLLGRHGVHREIIARGATATINSGFAPYGDAEWERVRHEMNDIYVRFIGRVAAGRARPAGEIEAVARGRVWTGRQAHERGLIDELGDFRLAVRRARELAGIPEAREVSLLTVRPPRAAGVPRFRGALAEAGSAWNQVRTLIGDHVLLLTEALRIT